MQIKRQRGFTLVEIIIGIVVFSISLTIVANFLVPTAIQSANQIQSIRASELAQSLMNEILAKSFDENSNRVGGFLRCGEDGVVCSPALGNEGESRENYNDVDDYHTLTMIDNIHEGLNDDPYQGFSLAVEVFYDGNFDGIDDGAISGAKLIKISVTPPSGDTLVFAGYKVNF